MRRLDCSGFCSFIETNFIALTSISPFAYSFGLGSRSTKLERRSHRSPWSAMDQSLKIKVWVYKCDNKFITLLSATGPICPTAELQYIIYCTSFNRIYHSDVMTFSSYNLQNLTLGLFRFTESKVLEGWSVKMIAQDYSLSHLEAHSPIYVRWWLKANLHRWNNTTVFGII